MREARHDFPASTSARRSRCLRRDPSHVSAESRDDSTASSRCPMCSRRVSPGTRWPIGSRFSIGSRSIAASYRARLSAPLTFRQRLLARALSVNGVASHTSAGVLYGLLPERDAVELTVRREARTRSCSDCHSTTCLPPCDVTSVDEIPCTAPARTLLDLGGSLPRAQFEDVLDVALIRRLVTPPRLAAACRRPLGATPIRLRRHARAPRRAEPGARERAQPLGGSRHESIARRGAPDADGNHPVVVGGRRRVIDFAWPDHGVAVEFDGFEAHSSRRVFDDDRVRQNDLVDEGWRVFRLTATALTGRPRAGVTADRPSAGSQSVAGFALEAESSNLLEREGGARRSDRVRRVRRSSPCPGRRRRTCSPCRSGRRRPRGR